MYEKKKIHWSVGGNLSSVSGNTGNKQQTKTADSGSIKVGYLLSSDGDAPDTVARVQGIRKMQEETGMRSISEGA